MATKHSCGQLRAAKGKTTQKQDSTSTTANTYGYMTPPDTGDISALRDFKFEHNPAIPYMYANARNKLESSYNSPTGGYTNPQIRDAQIRAGSRGLAQDESQALREENTGFQGMQFGQKQAVAGMTAPRLVNTGGTTKGDSTTTLQQPFDWNSIIQGGASIGSAFIG
jgi:hypothetical protein